MSLVLEFLSTFVVSFCEILSWHNISKEKLNLKNWKFFVSIVVLTIINIMNYHFMNNFVKGVGIMIAAIIFCKIILEKDLKDCIILSFLGELLVVISEAILCILLTILFKLTINVILDSSIIIFMNDILIGLILVLTSRLSFVSKIYKFISKITKNIKEYQIILFLIFVILVSSSIFATAYFQNNLYLILILNIVISLLYTIVIVVGFNYQNRYYKINYKYNISLDNLQAQELVINEYRMINHENKNQLLTIKSMTRNKQVIRYIDSLILQKEAFKNEIINTTLKLPEGGIRGLIYSKMLYMKDKNIDCYLNVDKKITSKILANISDNDIVDICHILGVFLDNAIQETLNLDGKKINIYLHLSAETLSINISNNHHQNFGTNKNNETLKTTKGKGHGYGLSLVKRIVDRNKRLVNNRKITRDTFTQELLIKLK